MGYRGEDLDLRTPQTWTASPTDLAGFAQPDGGRGRPSSVTRTGPIWVDETVLACCNHAFDVAMLNRASEVRLEHLLHALTRIEAAAEALEARGVRTATLRRESATVIASDIPVGLPAGKGVPRRSELLEEVLRLAAANAARRNAPASIDDLIQVMMDAESSVPSLSLLTRNTSRFSLPQETLLTRAPYPSEPRPMDYPDPGRLRFGTSTSYLYPDVPRPARPELLSTPVDNIQNSRLDSLEQMVRALSADISNERKVFAGMLQDVQRDVGAQRDDTSRLSGGILERLQLVDAGLERRLNEVSQSWTVLASRLQGLETALSSVKTSGGAVIDMQPVNERIAALERAVQAGLAEGQRASTALSDKVVAVQTAIASKPAVTAEGTIDLSAITNRLDMIEEGLLERESSVSDLADQISRIREVMNSEREKAAAGLTEIKTAVSGLMGAIEGESGDAVSSILDPLNSRLEGLAGVIEGRHTEVTELVTKLTQGVENLSARLAATERNAAEQAVRFSEWQKTYAQELSEVHEALMKLNTNQHTLAGSMETWRKDGSAEITALESRLTSTLEREVQKPLNMIEPMNVTLTRLDKMASEREFRRGRPWYWLFGTKDWVGASWPSQAQRASTDDWKSFRSIWNR